MSKDGPTVPLEILDICAEPPDHHICIIISPLIFIEQTGMIKSLYKAGVNPPSLFVKM